MEYFCAAGKRQFLYNPDFFVWGTDIRGLMRGNPQGNQELQWSVTRLEDLTRTWGEQFYGM